MLESLHYVLDRPVSTISTLFNLIITHFVYITISIFCSKHYYCTLFYEIADVSLHILLELNYVRLCVIGFTPYTHYNALNRTFILCISESM